MNRLFGKNTKKQLMTQHSLMDDNDDDDDVFSQVEASFPEYCPPPVSLLPEPLRKPVRTTEKEAVHPSSPPSKLNIRGGGIGRYQSAQTIVSSPTKPPSVSPLRAVNTINTSYPRLSSPRRFSSPDRVPKFLSVATTATNVNNTKVSMLQNLRDRMKFGASNNGCNEGPSEQMAKNTNTTKTVTAKKVLETPSSLFNSTEFSEPFTINLNSDANTNEIAPASEAFTVTCTTLSDDTAIVNDADFDPATQLTRPKLKFSISSEPIQPKAGGATLKALAGHSDTSNEEKCDAEETDAKESAGFTNNITESNGKQRVTKVIRASRKKTTDKRPKTPTKESTIDIVTAPKTPLAESTHNTEIESINNKDDKHSSSTKASTNSSTNSKSILKTPKKIAPSDKDTSAIKVLDVGIEESVINQDEEDEKIDPPSLHQKPKSAKKDHAPQTPKRTYSSDDEAQFFVCDKPAAGGGAADDDADEKINATKTSRRSTSTLRPKTPKKASAVDVRGIDIAPSEMKSKESKKSYTKSPKSPIKDSSSKKKKSASSTDKITTPKTPTKKESSTSKSKEKDQSKRIGGNEKQSTSNKKKSTSTTKKQKRRNSTNTVMASDENDDDNNNSSIPIIGNKWLGIIDTKELTSSVKPDMTAMPKRRNSCTSIASSITMETMLPSASAFTLPDAFSETLDDDVPPWVKAAMHMIEQYQKNKDFVPPVDPLAMLPISSTSAQPIEPHMNTMVDLNTSSTHTSVAAADHIPEKNSSLAATNTTYLDAPKAPKRAESFSSGSSSSSSCSSDCIKEKPTCTHADSELISSGENYEKRTLLSDVVEDSQQQQQNQLDAMDVEIEQVVLIPSKSDHKERKNHQSQLSKEKTKTAPISRTKSSNQECFEALGRSIDFSMPISRTKSSDQECFEALGRSVDFSMRSKTPQRGIIPIEKSTGPKISLHSSALYKRDSTPCRSRSSSGNDVNNNVATTGSTASGKDRFRELRRLAKQAANEPVSSDDEEHGNSARIPPPQPSTRRGGTTKASFRNNSNSNCTLQTSLTKSTLPEDQTIKDTINEISADTASPSRKEPNGNIHLRNLRRMAKRAANEPLSDDEDEETGIGGDGDEIDKINNIAPSKHAENETVLVSSTVPAPAPAPAPPVRSSILRSKSKTLENIPSLQQRKERLFDK